MMTNELPQLDDLKVLDLLLEEAEVERPDRPEIRRTASAAPVLSRAQRRIWFLQQMAPDSPAYVIVSAVTLSGRLDLAALRSSLHEIVRRHDALRTCFPAIDGRPGAARCRDWVPDIPIDDLTELPEPARRERVTRLCEEETCRPFDLTTGPLLRLRLLRLAEWEHIALLGLHHIVTDGWSMGVLVGELSRLYAAFAEGRPSSLPELSLRYSDFAAWQEEWLDQDAAREQRRWWLERLAGLTPLELPTDRPRPVVPSHRGAVHAFALPDPIAAKLRALGRREGATPFMTLLAAFAVLLHRYTGQEDIVVGSPVANRNRRELEPLIGLFVNTLVMRCDLSGRPSFLDVLRRVRDFTGEALDHQDLPFEELVKALAPDRDLSSNPLFQVLFALETAPAQPLHLPALTLTPVEVAAGIAKVDLLLTVSETGDGRLAGAFEYATDLFDATTVARMAGHFTTLLTAIAADPAAPVATLPLLTAAEHRQLAAWNDTATPYPRNMGLATLFELQARRSPDATAIEFGTERLTYSELNARSNRLARRLRECGVGAETPVALHTRRSAGLIAGMLAIVKAGGFYVPLDPAYPQPRLERMLADCRAPVLLTERYLLGRLPEGPHIPVCLDDALDPARYSEADPDWSAAGGGELAYVMYTSGSTGQPKGVEVPHRAVARLVLDTDYVAFGPDDVVGQASNASFDAATFEIWGALLNGSRLVGIDQDLILTPPELAAFLRNRRITILFLTTALFNQLAREMPDAFRTLRDLLVGGDQIDPNGVREVLRHSPPERLLNAYGPTENTTFSTWKQVLDVPAGAKTVPIGRAVANTQVHVLDAHAQPLPVGVPGELFLAGDGLARGYYGRPEATAERFIPNPFDGGRTVLYRTGDIVRRLPAGDIEFLGRRDNQVKIRGYRIELGEIETALLRHPAVRAAVVLAREDRPGQRELVAYVVGAEGNLDLAALRRDLTAELPGYMVPAKFVVLPALPLNENGKIDRKALPAPTAAPELSGALRPPDDPRELCLAGIWQDVLGCPQVGIHDNYFELGGDSIAAILVVSRLKRAGWRLDVRSLFQNPTIAALAPQLVRLEAETVPAEPVAGPVPLSATQRWFFRHHEGPLHHFNQAVLLEPGLPLDMDALRTALDALWRHHDALRATFDQGADGTFSQTFGVPVGFTGFTVRDLRTEADPDAALLSALDGIHSSFDLARGPLFKAVLFRLLEGERLLLAAHHLVIDGVSWRILLEDLKTAYAGGDPGARTASLRDWAELQAEFAADPALSAEASYWSGVLAEAAPEPPRPASTWGAVRAVGRRLTPELTSALVADAHRAFGTEVPDLLLAALANALARWDAKTRHLVTVEGHGREALLRPLDLTRTVGWFTSLFPVVLDACADPGRAIRQTKEMLRRVPRKGAGFLPIAELTDAALPEHRPRISFNYLGRFGSNAGDSDTGLFRFAPEATGTPIAAQVSRPHDLDVGAIVTGDAMDISIHFDPDRDPVCGVEALLNLLVEELDAMAGFGLRHPAPERTPSDLLAGRMFDLDSYERFLAGNGWTASRVEEVAPLTPLQEGLLVQARIDPDPSSYFIQIAFTLSGPVEAPPIGAAWKALASHHPLLCAAFTHRDVPRPVQVVLKDRGPEVLAEDWSALPPEEWRGREAAFRAADLARGFDLTRDPPMRAAVFTLGDGCHRIVWSFHHIVLDRWSLGIVYRDWLDLLQGRQNLPSAPSLADYLCWLDRQPAAGSEEYWRTLLDGYGSLATLPRLRPPESGRLYDPQEVSLEIDAATTAALRDLAAREGATLGTALQALWGLVLARHNGTEDVVFGTVVSGRPAAVAGIDRMVGLFINTIPVRVRIGDRCGIKGLVRDLQAQWLTGEPHHVHPLAEILAASPLGRNTFDHLLTVENTPWDGQADASAGLSVGGVEFHDRTHYDFFIVAVPGDTLSLSFKYNAAVYDAGQIERLSRHFAMLVQAVLAAPDDPALELEMLPDEERETVLYRFNSTAAPSADAVDLVTILEHRAATMPDAPALRFDPVTLTYRELDSRADRIASWLAVQPGVGPDARIGLHMDRSDWLVAALWGILKAGAAFVPLDPADPAERVRFIIEDAGCAIVLADPRHAAAYADLPAVTAVDPRAVADRPAQAPVRHHRPGSLAYVIYTSGTTGKPKGVMVEHRNLSHYIAWAARHYYPDGNGGSFGLHSSFAFDLTITSLFLPVYCGRTLHVFAQDRDPQQMLADGLDSALGIDTLKLTPSHISLLRDMDPARTGVRVAIVGGEALSPDQVACLERLNPAMAIHNEYGPTETTVGCIVRRVRSTDWRILIGRPIDNTAIYILDRALRPVPIGVAEEIFIGGAGVTRGYLNQPDLNAERFLASPFNAGERLFRTGDTGRWLPDGEIDFLGRNDSQVKIRGHRIEPGEIEAILVAHPAVSKACVTALTDSTGGKALAAYVVSNLGDLPATDLRRHLRDRLPDYMMPDWLIPSDDIPLTINGKVDHRRLPPPADLPSRLSMPPRTETERRLCALWSAVLGRSGFGIDDSFFDLGGHSLKAMQVTAQIHRDFGVQVSLRDIFDQPTIAALGNLIDATARSEHGSSERWSHIPPAPVQDHYELSHAQRRLWLMHQMDGAAAYNIPQAHVIGTEIDAAILERALRTLIRRHDSLRTAFVVVDGEPRQQIRAEVPFSLAVSDLRACPAPERQAREIADREANQSFDLTEPPLLRASLVHLPESRSLFVLTMHHIIADGWSNTLVYQELLGLYDAYRHSRPEPLRPLRIQYKDFAAWQNARGFQRQEQYWLPRLSGMPERTLLPYDFAPEAARDFSGATLSVDLGGEVAAGLRRLAARRRTTPSTVMLALFDLALFHWTRQEDLCVGMSVANRNHPDVENLIGFFVNMLPIRCRLSADMEFDDLLALVIERTREALEHQDYPFDLMIQHINPARQANRQPLVNVMYTYQNFTDIHVDVVQGGVAPEESDPVVDWTGFEISFATSKFDLTLFVLEEAGTIRLTLEYDSGLFLEPTIRAHLQTIADFAGMVAGTQDQ
jgi:amino acid adenylation domain-containing protein/non-ribosomal peptide synthase protein (TIGR01720 family)